MFIQPNQEKAHFCSLSPSSSPHLRSSHGKRPSSDGVYFRKERVRRTKRKELGDWAIDSGEDGEQKNRKVRRLRSWRRKAETSVAMAADQQLPSHMQKLVQNIFIIMQKF
ncbi:hypothetical protein ACS0TY_011669 [Phlomoides rotata]